ncbi:hypothetical protein AN641_03445 [Candidatus Epulonipiscioides gigas]|nr:hypothetical protein AN641_03445 [Epulopiscium sp. SCG-C07WGA-EpuloA2]
MRKENILFFFEALYTLIKSGINLYETLVIIHHGNPKKEINKLTKILINHIQKGETFSEALSKVNHIPAFIISAIKAGEKSGSLEEILEIIMNQLKIEVEMTKKIKQVTLYPKIVGVTMLFSLLISVKFIFPTLTKTFSEQDITLPFVTRAFIQMTDFLNHNYLLLIILITTCFVGLNIFKKWAYGNKLLEQLKIKIPKIGTLYKLNHNKEIANYIGLLISSGLSIGEATEIFRKSTNSYLLKSIFEKSNKNIIQGKFLSETLKDKPIIMSYLLEIIKIGEKSGGLGASLLRIGKYFEKNYEIELKKAIAIIEPTITLFLALIVAFIVAATMLPTLSLSVSF